MMMVEDEGRPAGGASESDQARPAGSADRDGPVAQASGGQAAQRLGDMHNCIGSRLRQAFDDIASQPVPDRFLQLMQDLDKA